MLDQHVGEMTPAQREKQATFESIEYFKSYTSAYTAHLWRRHARQARGRGKSRSLADQLEEKRSLTRWGLHIAIAVAVGVVAFTVLTAIAALEDFRVDTLESSVEDAGKGAAGYFAGLAFWLASGSVLVVLAACVVVFFEPAAGGSGIPEVMAYLNGVAMPKVVSLRTFVGKSLSCIGAVAGGLPVGAEAPLIHLGAIVGAGVTQGRSRTLGCQTNFFREFRNNRDKRDFITAGAACGVSAAFGAPIGGLLFVMEEVSSFWDLASTGQLFLGTMLCFTIIALINSTQTDVNGRGFVSNKVGVMFEVEYAGDTALNVASIIPAAALGVLTGLLAAVFTKGNLAVVRWRRANIKPHRFRRVLEPVVVILIFAFLGFTVPYATQCVPTVNRYDSMAAANVTLMPDGGEDDNAAVQSWHTENGTHLATYLCKKENEYNPLATLTVKGVGKGSIRRLFSRRTVDEFPLPALFVFFVLYFTFAGYISGAAISSGMVIPMIVIGATIGRIYGVSLVHLFADRVHNAEGATVKGYVANQAWMDPGVFALIGAGAFFGGVSRMTMSLSVIMVELSGELHYLLPIMVAIITSKGVADALCEPLYHQLMALDFVPYLAHDAGADLEVLTAGDVCSEGVVCLHKQDRVAEVIDALQTGHHVFPVVDGPRFVGTTTREDLQILLALPRFQAHIVAHQQKQAQMLRDGTSGSAPPARAVDLSGMRYDDWLQHKMSLFFVQGSSSWHANWSPEGIARRERDRAAVATSPSAAAAAAAAAAHDVASPVATAPDGALSRGLAEVPGSPSDLPRDDSICIDLEVVLNRSPWSVTEETNGSHVFGMFRTLGLRHIVVLRGERVVGIISRKDLLPHSLKDATRKALGRRQRGRERSLGEEDERSGLDGAAISMIDDEGGDGSSDDDEVAAMGGGFFGAVKAFFAPRYNVHSNEMDDYSDDDGGSPA
jgi:H+/Cl- antiporter ClcA/predicted transcriptional regulator